MEKTMRCMAKGRFIRKERFCIKIEMGFNICSQPVKYKSGKYGEYG